jgi:hypothetical protein
MEGSEGEGDEGGAGIHATTVGRGGAEEEGGREYRRARGVVGLTAGWLKRGAKGLVETGRDVGGGVRLRSCEEASGLLAMHSAGESDG